MGRYRLVRFRPMPSNNTNRSNRYRLDQSVRRYRLVRCCPLPSYNTNRTNRYRLDQSVRKSRLVRFCPMSSNNTNRINRYRLDQSMRRYWLVQLCLMYSNNTNQTKRYQLDQWGSVDSRRSCCYNNRYEWGTARNFWSPGSLRRVRFNVTSTTCSGRRVRVSPLQW